MVYIVISVMLNVLLFAGIVMMFFKKTRMISFFMLMVLLVLNGVFAFYLHQHMADKVRAGMVLSKSGK